MDKIKGLTIEQWIEKIIELEKKFIAHEKEREAEKKQIKKIKERIK